MSSSDRTPFKYICGTLVEENNVIIISGLVAFNLVILNQHLHLFHTFTVLLIINLYDFVSKPVINENILPFHTIFPCLECAVRTFLCRLHKFIEYFHIALKSEIRIICVQVVACLTYSELFYTMKRCLWDTINFSHAPK